MSSPINKQAHTAIPSIEINDVVGTPDQIKVLIHEWLAGQNNATLSEAIEFIAQLTDRISEQNEQVRNVFERTLGSDISRMRKAIVSHLIAEARKKGHDGDLVATCNDLQEICRMPDSEAARSTFSKLWRMREAKLQGTSESISQSPNCICHTLLVEVAKVLFSTKTTGEFLKLVDSKNSHVADTTPLSSEQLKEALTVVERNINDNDTLEELSEELVKEKNGQPCRLHSLLEADLLALLEARYSGRPDHLAALFQSYEGQKKLAECPRLFLFLARELPAELVKNPLIRKPLIFKKLLEKLQSAAETRIILSLFRDSPKELRKLLTLPYITGKWEENPHSISGLVQAFSDKPDALWTICGPGDSDERGWIGKKWHALRPSRLENWQHRWGILNDILAQTKSTAELVAAQTALVNALNQSNPDRLSRTLLARSSGNRTALHWMARQGQTDLVQAILNTQDTPEAKDKLLRARDSSGHTCIFLAACAKETPSVLIPMIEALKSDPALLAKRLLQVERRRKTSALQMAIRTSPDWKAIMQTLEGAFSNRKDLLKNCLIDQRSLFGAFRGWFRSSADDPEINDRLKENLDYKAGRIRRSYRAIKRWFCLPPQPAPRPDMPLPRKSVLELIELKHGDTVFANQLRASI